MIFKTQFLKTNKLYLVPPPQRKILGGGTLGLSVSTIDKNPYYTNTVYINLMQTNNSKIRKRKVNQG